MSCVNEFSSDSLLACDPTALVKTVTKHLILCAALCLALSACSTSKLEHPSPSSHATPVLDAAEIELFTLDQTYEEAFYSYFNDPANIPTPEHERVANFLSILIDRFTYIEETRSAQNALDSMAGNCLSLALITRAYAKLANVPIRFQLLGANPVFELDRDLLIKTDHIRSVLSGQWQTGVDLTFDTRRDIRIDYFPTEGLKYRDHLSEAALISLFYNNKAVESMQRGDLERAMVLAKKSLKLDGNNAAALNTPAIVHRRQGNDAAAEALYLRARKDHPDNLSFVRNYMQLLKRQGRTDEAQSLAALLERSEQENPWSWVLSGQSHERAGRYTSAITHYQRALDIQGDLHQVHFYLGIAHYKNGNTRQSKYHLAEAVKYSEVGRVRKNYKRKLRALN